MRIISKGGIVLSRLGSGIVLNVDIFRAHLKKKACSTNVELDGAEVNFWEAFLSVHTEIFKASSIISVQKINILFGSFELHNSVLFGFLKKGA